ncbi:MAG: leader peptide processing enzyme [Spirochaetia bacterium]|jgi:drug/metabolite transporter (DMT)-like permease|nr:leader peptide processing enzyme [Spirochaetia bacterium]
MTKKTNTVIFIIVATLVNMLLMLVLGIGAFILFIKIFGTDSNRVLVGMLVALVIGIGGSMFIYSKGIKWVSNKWHLDEKLSPLFSSRHHHPSSGR